MARGRFISESVAKDMRLNSLSVEAELVYLMTIPHLDRDGLIEGDTDVLYGTVCPKRRIFIDRMGEFIQEWVQVGLVAIYDSSEGQVLWFRGFTKNQSGLRYDRETASRFPPPPGYERGKDGLTETDTPPDDGSIRQNAGGVRQTSAQWQEQVEVKVKVEVKDQVEVAATQRATLDDEVIFDSPAQSITPAIAPAKPKVLTPQQEMYGAICEALGWDYHVIAEREQVRVAQAVKILSKAEYGVEDIRRFMVDIWFHDWRWQKHGQYPTLEQLRQEIGKLRNVAKQVAPPKRKGVDGYREMLAGQGIQL